MSLSAELGPVADDQEPQIVGAVRRNDSYWGDEVLDGMFYRDLPRDTIQAIGAACGGLIEGGNPSTH